MNKTLIPFKKVAKQHHGHPQNKNIYATNKTSWYARKETSKKSLIMGSGIIWEGRHCVPLAILAFEYCSAILCPESSMQSRKSQRLALESPMVRNQDWSADRQAKRPATLPSSQNCRTSCHRKFGRWYLLKEVKEVDWIGGIGGGTLGYPSKGVWKYA